jgi:CheY-like chemotaxis protein
VTTGWDDLSLTALEGKLSYICGYCLPIKNNINSKIKRIPSMNGYASIIMAEDDLVAQKVTSRMLRKIGLSATAVNSGRRVLQALEARHYDIVLMDIEMPEMDGIEATRIIREHWPIEPKIIIVTNCDSTAYRELCFSAGVNEFLAKPLKLEDLTAAIERNKPLSNGEVCTG